MAERNSTQPNINNRRFFMTATQPIQAKVLINPGDNVLIDPDKLPEPGNMVLVGDNLEWWNGQHDIRGVAISVEQDLIKDESVQKSTPVPVQKVETELEKESTAFAQKMVANLRALK